MTGAEELAVLLAGDTPLEMAATFLAAVSATVGVATVAVPGLRRLVAPPLKQSRITDLVQLDTALADGRTLRTREGGLTATIEVAGLDMAGATEGERLARRAERKAMFLALSELNVHVRVYELHEKVARPQARVNRPPRGDAEGLVMRQRIVERWEKQFAFAFRNRHVIALSVGDDSEGARERLDKARVAVARALHEYGPRDLGEREDGGSDLLEWWGSLLSRVSRPQPVGRSDLARRLMTDRVYLDPDTGLLTWRHGQAARYAHVVGVSSWGQTSSEDMAAQLMALDGEVLIVHQAHVHSEMTGQVVLKHIERGAASTWVSSQAREEFDTVKEIIQPNAPERERLMRYSMTVIAFGDTPAEARTVAENVENVIKGFEAETVIEGDVAGVVWWGTQPGWEAWGFVRELRPVCQNAADLIPFETPREGLRRCAWGEGYMLRARTSSGTPYYVNLHEGPGRDELAHAAWFGRTGSGKTTEVDMLVYGALEHFPGLLGAEFDSRFGSYVSTTMAGGRYVSLLGEGVGGVAAQLQPLQRPLTIANQAHLVKLLRLLTGLSDPEAERAFQMLLKTLLQMDRTGSSLDSRTLQELVPTVFERGSPVRTAMEKWLPGGSYGSVFSGTDHLPIEGADLYAFDFTTALKDPVLAGPLVEDVSHLVTERVRSGARGGILKIDETAHLWSNPVFLGKGVDWLAQLRKDLIAVITMWQRPSQLSEVHPNLPAIIRSQTATWVFHRDRGAKRADYAEWVTDQEFAFIDGSDGSYDHMDHPLLFKKPNAGESQVLEFSTSVLGELDCAFSSDKDRVARARVLQEWDPVGWRDSFVDEFGGR